MNADTIVAPASATGGAIAVVRLSGPDAVTLAAAAFRGRRLDKPGVYYGRLYDGEELLDEVVLTVFRAPHSYTAEDAVEISAHGAAYLIRRIVQLFIRAGARAAAPGEFTARAYLAGKMDLAQAEAVADLIAADSRAAHSMASSQLRGGISTALGALRAELVRLAALVELELDFSEEEVEFAARTELRVVLQRLLTEVVRLRDTFELGNAIRSGVTVAIVGEPNAGKSTLLNFVLGDDRALVSAVAGTTRDTIEETLRIGNVLFRFVDTAGLRETADELERAGIARTRAALERAQVVLHLFDVSLPAPAVLPVAQGQHYLRVGNKVDVKAAGNGGADFYISARTGAGVPELLAHLTSLFDVSSLLAGDTVISSARHAEALDAAFSALQTALDGLSPNSPGTLSTDLLAEEIRSALFSIGTITGETTPDEVLQEIFGKFCIGK